MNAGSWHGLSTATTAASVSTRAALIGVTAYLQPIVQLSSGRVVGFETLVRKRVAESVLAPVRFLPGFSEDDRVSLLAEMLRFASRFVASSRTIWPDLYVSVNVESSLILRDDFCDLVAAEIPSIGGPAPAIYLEILESEKLTDLDRAFKTLDTLRAMGIGAALDDVGSAYSSLMLLKRLPIDMVKLDQAFARELPYHPEDLQFVHSIMSLARGLGCKLTVEGVETPAILDALRVIGVDYGQGYAVARPMPLGVVDDWITHYRPASTGKGPNSLLGAYAAYLNIVESCRILMTQPLPVHWAEEARDPHACAIGAYLERMRLQRTPLGLAHRHFHDVVHLYGTDRDRWSAAADAFRQELTKLIQAETQDLILSSRTDGPSRHACHGMGPGSAEPGRVFPSAS